VYSYGLDDRAIEVRSPAEAKDFSLKLVFAVAFHTAWNTHQNHNHATGKITNNTHSNKYTTIYSKLDENYGTREHIKVGNKVQRSDTTTKYIVEHNAKKQ
jgi:hypothetical protein